jgi:hypothetical protein
MTSAKYMWDMVFTFDPLKLHNTTEQYKARKERIDTELKAQREKVWKTFGAGTHAAMFALAPAAYLAGAPTMKAVTSREGIADYFREMGFGAPSEKEKEGGAKKPTGILDIPGQLLGKLRDVFLESPEHVELIAEQKGVDVSDIDVTLQQVAPEEVAKMRKGGEDFIEFTNKFLDDVWESSGKNIASLRTIKKAKTFDEFVASFEKARKEGFDVKGPSSQELKKHFDDSIKELMTGEDREKFVNTLLQTTGKKSPEELTEEELLKAAEKTVFLSSTEKIRADLTTVEVDLMKKMGEALKDVRPSMRDAKALKQTEAGQRFLELYDDFFAKVMAEK